MSVNLNNIKTSERERDPEHCLKFLLSHIKNRDLSYQQDKYGERFSIYKTTIVDQINNRKYIGSGKGYGDQGIVSSLAECYQHYLSFNTISSYSPEKIPTLSSIEISYHLRKYGSDKFSKMFPDDGKRYSTLIYQNISEDSDFLYYPLSLTEPRYNKLPNVTGDGSLVWRSHDTGSALGMSYSEALLHGINEWIEKYSYSLFLSKNFFSSSKNRKIDFLEKTSLPAHLQELIDYVEQTYNDDLSIILLNNEFNIPSVLAVFNKQADCATQPKGLSCSLYKEYAIEKAVFEALQCRVLRNQNVVQKEAAIIQSFTNYPLFLKAYQSDFSDIAGVTVDYKEMVSHESLSPSDQISYIEQLLQKNGGHKIYSHTFLKEESSGLTSLQVIIPGLNEMFLIKEGKFIFESS